MNYSASAPPPSYSLAKQLIRDRTARIGIVGLGCVGIPLGYLFEQAGFAVDGFDFDESRVRDVQTTRHIPLPNSLPPSPGWRGQFHVNADLAKVADTDVIIFCIPSPISSGLEAELRYIREATFSIASNLHAGHLFVLDGNTYPGVTETIVVPLLESANSGRLTVSRNTGDPNDFFVGISPDREDPANVAVERRDIPKVVSGFDLFSRDLTAALYGSVFRRIVSVSSPAAAEMTKFLENTFQAVNIASAKEWKMICLRMGMDVWELIEAAATRPSGNHNFYPDPTMAALRVPPFPLSMSRRSGQSLISAADAVNLDACNLIVEFTSQALIERNQTLDGANVLVLSQPYEVDGDGLYGSPSRIVCELLQNAGAHVDIALPGPLPPGETFVRRSIALKGTPLDDVSAYHAVVIMADCSAFDYSSILLQAPLIIDTMNVSRGIESDKILRC